MIYATGHAAEAAAFGVPHTTLGQAIVAVVKPTVGSDVQVETLLEECKRRLPAFMVPALIKFQPESLPRNPNGKIDRKLLAQELQNSFVVETSL